MREIVVRLLVAEATMQSSEVATNNQAATATTPQSSQQGILDRVFVNTNGRSHSAATECDEMQRSFRDVVLGNPTCPCRCGKHSEMWSPA